jgi:hypothetical protein
MHQRFARSLAIAIVAVCTLFAGASLAQPAMTLRIEWAGNTWNAGPSHLQLTPDPTNPNVWSYTGGHTHTAWAGQWSGVVDVDPAINSAFAITNNTAVDQTFIVTLSLPTVGAITAPSTIFGGTTVSISGAGSQETVSTPAGDFLYRAFTGAGFVGAPADLLPSPFSLSSDPIGLPNAHGPVNYGPANGPGLAAVDSIGIRHAFVLTPGGTATVNGTFVIVPEPTSLGVLALAGFAVIRRRNRA